MELLDKAFALCAEIQDRQNQLIEILQQLAQTQQEPIAEPAPIFIQESVVAPRQRPDIRKAFTINDRFRFRRELFAGDDNALRAVIDHLATLDTLAEADAYLSTMMWDHDSEAIGEFMTIVSNHFNSK